MVILTVNPALLSTTMLVLINVNTSLHNELSISGVGTMGTGGYIVPYAPKFRTCTVVPPVPPSQRCGLCQTFKQTTLTTRLYKVRTNLYPHLRKHTDALAISLWNSLEEVCFCSFCEQFQRKIAKLHTNGSFPRLFQVYVTPQAERDLWGVGRL